MKINFDSIDISDLTTVVISFIAAFIAWQAWEAQKSNNLIYLNEMIENARNGYTELMRLKIESTKNDIEATEEYKNLFFVTIENLVNAYESASAFYLSGWWFFGVINKQIFKELELTLY